MNKIQFSILIMAVLIGSVATVEGIAVIFTGEEIIYDFMTDFVGDTNFDGNLNHTGGNATINMIYGEMYNYSGSATPYTFDIDDADTYYNLSGLTTGDCNGFEFVNNATENGGSYLITQVSGLYKSCLTLSFASQAQGGLYGIAVTHNFDVDKHRECYSRRAAATAVGNVGVCCLIDADVGDIINVQVENENNARDMFIHTVNLNLLRVGDVK